MLVSGQDKRDALGTLRRVTQAGVKKSFDLGCPNSVKIPVAIASLRPVGSVAALMM